MKRKRKYRSLAGISIKARCPREGMRVVFNPNPASRMMYSYRVPRAGTRGRVTTIPTGRGRATCMRGPGGGLVYVDWDDGGTMGVSSIDLDKVRR